MQHRNPRSADQNPHVVPVPSISLNWVSAKVKKGVLGIYYKQVLNKVDEFSTIKPQPSQVNFKKCKCRHKDCFRIHANTSNAEEREKGISSTLASPPAQDGTSHKEVSIIIKASLRPKTSYTHERWRLCAL